MNPAHPKLPAHPISGEWLPTHWLRVEAVNLDGLIGDTLDLSCIRGGGLLALWSVDAIDAWLGSKCGLDDARKITGGASWGLFELRLPETTDAAAIEEALAKWLALPDKDLSFLDNFPDAGWLGSVARGLCHATFVVAAEPATRDPDGYRKATDRLLARNRRRQLQQATFVADPWTDGTNVPDRGPCHYDRVRAAVARSVNPAGTAVMASASAAWRHDFGRVQRRKFYSREAWPSEADVSVVQTDDDYTDDLGSLSGGVPELVPQVVGDKIAVIYADGNGFGKLVREHCPTAADQRLFDGFLRPKQRDLLHRLVAAMDPDHDWWAESLRRIETLLWGGDEIIWVVPAWKGFEVVEHFFETTADWNFESESGKSWGLSHAVGIVFAHRNAPIHPLVALARTLADSAKEQIRKSGEDIYATGSNRPGNVWDYEVLESFDQVGSDLEAHRRRRIPVGMDPGELMVRGERTVALGRALRALHAAEFPTRQTHRQFHSWRESKSMASARDQVARDPNLIPYERELSALADAAGDRTAWYHLASLWDYAARVPAAAAQRMPQ